MKYALTALAFVVSLLVVGVVAFFVVIFLAGPHADILPQPLEVLVGIAGWLAVLVLPILSARSVWTRMERNRVA
jgi:uncharacterized membrane protein YuzA (DUF378 family)